MPPPKGLVKKLEKDGPLEWVEDYAPPYSRQGRKERGLASAED